MLRMGGSISGDNVGRIWCPGSVMPRKRDGLKNCVMKTFSIGWQGGMWEDCIGI